MVRSMILGIFPYVLCLDLGIIYYVDYHNYKEKGIMHDFNNGNFVVQNFSNLVIQFI